jgi:hypothetical protein
MAKADDEFALVGWRVCTNPVNGGVIYTINN